ncbi:MAG: hypothetical protein SOU51_03255 [Collinsella sp.]|nr:hypothetical protein [Collinsella sp.]
MHDPRPGILCAGCPHRAALVAIKEASRGRRGKILCGDAGCPHVGAVHPAAATCPGGDAALPARYRKDIPVDGTTSQPAAPYCIHVILDQEVASADAPGSLGSLAAEGESVILAVMASSAGHLERGDVERLGQTVLEIGAGDVAILDPFDIARCTDVLSGQLDEPGVHGAIFASPCARLLLDGEATEPVEVDPHMCVGCQRCHQITGCPALSFTPPRYTVDASMCTGCDLCTGFCRTQIIYSPRNRLSLDERRTLRLAAALAGTGSLENS